MKFLYSKAIVLSIFILLPSLVMSQTSSNGSNYSTAIPTAVPFLNITPDSRSGAMGDAGVAITPDVNATYWNPSKLAYLESNDNVSLSYSPWLRQLVPDISLSYLSYAHKLDERNTIGASLRYFNYGSIQLTDEGQNNQGTYTPNEFSLNTSFARKFGESFSLGLTVGFIHSSLSNAAFATGSGQQAKAGNALAAGVSMYYNKPTQEFGSDAIFAFGANISNIGSKISYSDGGPKYFLPANLKIGVANTINLDDYNQITLTVDLNKLLVPTPPIRDQNGNIIKGKDDNVSVPAGIFGSFSDAPGGFHEELQEISISPGAEYWYNQLFAIRAGYFYQNANKGGAHYLTAGIGLKYDAFRFDFSYLAASQQNSPLANTLRFTLSASFGGDTNSKKR
ncbi:type IX secretion system outer membrane channel protein PorV [Mucilaginibacter sp. L3T2-6]|uniref:type IX secretion system outer membrane channel protein PorV n=1 Tax=Mucilaginibacter sp. L3T2-6 TaxID=3062491 RepID=UPI002677642C|nr:type IX secretion system outer membrane channel protein PorV [Mucilaginibacter sp. L3T2-6]MDO3640749.1 type IX secretion system outer membrane channel protein PorV [Mucilaginibacter sp. L3T2-6]MDV6212910.1 type IX secretion system outer membrane channel protein PorV [Mucilaginibacter sp. L3T2-6]